MAQDVELQKAKIRRARELVVEAGDMDMGDAAVLFMLAAVEAEHLYFDKIAKDVVAGKPDATLKEDSQFFRVAKEVLGDKFPEAFKGFTESAVFRQHIHEAAKGALRNTLNRCLVAFLVMQQLEKSGKSL